MRIFRQSKVLVNLNKSLADELLNQPTEPTVHSNKKIKTPNKAQNTIKPKKYPVGWAFLRTGVF